MSAAGSSWSRSIHSSFVCAWAMSPGPNTTAGTPPPEIVEDAITAVKDSGRGTALIKAERGGNVRFIGLPLEQK